MSASDTPGPVMAEGSTASFLRSISHGSGGHRDSASARSRLAAPVMKLSDDAPPQSLFEEFSQMLSVTSNLQLAPGDQLSRRGLLMGGLGGLASMAASPMLAAAADYTPWATKTMLDAIENGQVEKVAFSPDGKQIVCYDIDGNRHASLILETQTHYLMAALNRKEILYTVEAAPSNQPQNGFQIAGQVLNGLLNLAFPLFLFSLLSRGGGPGQAGAGGPGGMNPFSVGKSQ